MTTRFGDKHGNSRKVPPTRTRALTTVRSKAMPDTPPNSIVTRSAAFMEPSERLARIAEAAYYHSQRRGFDPGHELDDWLAAEAEIDQSLANAVQPTLCG
jgi:phosphoglucomutase